MKPESEKVCEPRRRIKRSSLDKTKNKTISNYIKNAGNGEEVQANNYRDSGNDKETGVMLRIQLTDKINVLRKQIEEKNKQSHIKDAIFISTQISQQTKLIGIMNENSKANSEKDKALREKNKALRDMEENHKEWNSKDKNYAKIIIKMKDDLEKCRNEVIFYKKYIETMMKQKNSGNLCLLHDYDITSIPDEAKALSEKMVEQEEIGNVKNILWTPAITDEPTSTSSPDDASVEREGATDLTSSHCLDTEVGRHLLGGGDSTGMDFHHEASSSIPDLNQWLDTEAGRRLLNGRDSSNFTGFMQWINTETVSQLSDCMDTTPVDF